MASHIVGDHENGVRSSEVIAMEIMGVLQELDASTETLCQLAEHPGPSQPHICQWMVDVHVFRTLVAAGVEVMLIHIAECGTIGMLCSITCLHCYSDLP